MQSLCTLGVVILQGSQVIFQVAYVHIRQANSARLKWLQHRKRKCAKSLSAMFRRGKISCSGSFEQLEGRVS